MTTQSLLVLPGDGIGPEVVAQAERVLDWFNKNTSANIEVSRDLLGGCAIDKHGVPISNQTMNAANASDAILVGAVGGAKWDDVDFDKRPEQGLLRLRKDLSLFANFRPAMCFDALADHSTLKRHVVEGLDIVIVRELTAGLYFGEPRGVFADVDGQRRGVNTQSYTDSEIARVARRAFQLARTRQGRLCSMEKSNVMEAGALWREIVADVHAAEFTDIELSHMYADNGAMQLVRDPKQFDVILTDNMFGDILSDEAAMLTGSLGMLPSASLGTATPQGISRGLYEPVHGSAPDIAGQNKANPLATILSLSMAFRHSFGLPSQADRLDGAVDRVLKKGVKTADLLNGQDQTAATTEEMGTAVIEQLNDDLAMH